MLILLTCSSFSNDYPSPAAPTFDPASRRGSSDSQDVLQGLLLPGRRQSESSLPPLTPMSLGRKYDPPMARLAQRPALDVSIGRAEYTPTKTSFTAQSIWDSETDSHKFVLGSNTSAASSYTSRHSFLPF
jgi:hypothetical protein